MKNRISYLLTFVMVVLFVTNCNEPDTFVPKEENKEFGYLSLQLALQIQELPAGRLQVVNTDDFIVTIHNAADGSEVVRFDPFSSAPSEIELLTGEYFVRATNLEPPANAEFEQPWYFGESAVFNIDKEEVKTIDVECTLANFKVSFVYSQNVVDNFTDWNATATLINEGDFLFWPMGDDREGYFITSPLDINVYLEYTKVFTGELITRNFVTTIDDPQPATHYRINIDASLEDGKIVIDITVDESFDVIDIDLGDNTGSGENPTDFEGNEYQTVQIGNQVWMSENLRSTLYADGTTIQGLTPTTDPDNGYFYQWAAVMRNNPSSNTNPSGVQGVCPTGWHVPSFSEFSVMVNNTGAANNAAVLRLPNSNWQVGTLATNESGYSAEADGWWDHGTSIAGVGFWSYFWSSTEINGQSADGLGISTTGLQFQQGINFTKQHGFAIRCVKD